MLLMLLVLVLVLVLLVPSFSRWRKTIMVVPLHVRASARGWLRGDVRGERRLVCFGGRVLAAVAVALISLALSERASSLVLGHIIANVVAFDALSASRTSTVTF
jgi:hypothetical protein